MITAAIEAEAVATFGPDLPEIIDETEADRAERIAAAEAKAAEADRARRADRARDALPRWLESSRGRAPADLPEVEITAERAATLQRALWYLLDRCDGAKERDGAGFNRPDASIAHGIMAAQPALRGDWLILADRMLTRYRRQLAGPFPTRFNKEAA